MGEVNVPVNQTTLRPGDRICASDRLRDGGSAVRFRVEYDGRIEPAFVVRYAGQAFAYLNRCAHRYVELDWQEGNFFDVDRRYLVCATHGALYDPATGACQGGPCRGAHLAAVTVRETQGAVWLTTAPQIADQ